MMNQTVTISFVPEQVILVAALGIQAPAALQGGLTLRYFDVLVAFVGALIILAVVAVFWRRRL
ncbi:MAG: hypothetical protein K8I30_10875 [Anaerolineae bacterium]|nr:hypothetical protein [Anaerolineae bacterium]